jgi:hypothetical protein
MGDMADYYLDLAMNAYGLDVNDEWQGRSYSRKHKTRTHYTQYRKPEKSNKPTVQFLKLRDNPKLWINAEGDIIHIYDMDSKHLFNCVRLIERREQEQKGNPPPVYAEMIKELVKRGVITERYQQQSYMRKSLNVEVNLNAIYND